MKKYLFTLFLLLITSVFPEASFYDKAKTGKAKFLKSGGAFEWLAPFSEFKANDYTEKMTSKKLARLYKRLEGLKRWKHLLETETEGTFPAKAIIADIHGNLDGLQHLVFSLLGRGVNRFIFTGDYLDRDNQNLEVYSLIKTLKESDQDFEVELLLGNHCLLFLQAILGKDKEVFDYWYFLGGNQVLKNAGIDINQSLDKVFYDVGHNEELRDMAFWMRKHLKLFHEDETGFLFLHGGILMDKRGKVGLTYKNKRGMEALELLQEEFKNASFADKEQVLSFLSVSNMNSSPLWISWQAKSKANTNKLFDYLGINGLVFGHTTYEQMFKYENRVFGIDLGLTKPYGAKGGALIFDYNGIHVVNLDQNKGEKIKETVIPRKELLSQIENDIERIQKEIFRLNQKGSRNASMRSA